MYANLRSMTRQERIIAIMLAKEQATVRLLEEQLGVSSWTIRRDLDQLEAAGLISRRYGAVTLLKKDNMRELVGDDEAFDDAPAKDVLGRAAARLVLPGQSVLIAAGPITTEIARALWERNVRCEVVTNGLDIAQLLAEADNIKVTCTAARSTATTRRSTVLLWEGRLPAGCSIWALSASMPCRSNAG